MMKAAMDNAAGLIVALPQWYFATLLTPFSAGPFTAIPAFGVLCLAIGAVLGVRARAPSLWLFALLALASEAYVALAGVMRGAFSNSSDPITWLFLLLQIGLAGYLVYRLKGARVPAALLAVFTSSYALLASFIAAMSFSDTWL